MARHKVLRVNHNMLANQRRNQKSAAHHLRMSSLMPDNPGGEAGIAQARARHAVSQLDGDGDTLPRHSRESGNPEPANGPDPTGLDPRLRGGDANSARHSRESGNPEPARHRLSSPEVIRRVTMNNIAACRRGLLMDTQRRLSAADLSCMRFYLSVAGKDEQEQARALVWQTLRLRCDLLLRFQLMRPEMLMNSNDLATVRLLRQCASEHNRMESEVMAVMILQNNSRAILGAQGIDLEYTLSGVDMASIRMLNRVLAAAEKHAALGGRTLQEEMTALSQREIEAYERREQMEREREEREAQERKKREQVERQQRWREEDAQEQAARNEPGREAAGGEAADEAVEEALDEAAEFERREREIARRVMSAQPVIPAKAGIQN
mgnify:CR=1 FL=1